MSLELTEILAASAIIIVGATVQATVGFGLGLVAAPVLLLIEPMLVPGPLMVSGVILTLLIAYRDRQGLDFISLKWALWGRLLGVAPAALVLSVASQTVFDLIFALLVGLAVLLSALGISLQPTNRRTIIAGAASGFMGTISGIGGPPIAGALSTLQWIAVARHPIGIFLCGSDPIPERAGPDRSFRHPRTTAGTGAVARNRYRVCYFGSASFALELD